MFANKLLWNTSLCLVSINYIMKLLCTNWYLKKLPSPQQFSCGTPPTKFARGFIQLLTNFIITQVPSTACPKLVHKKIEIHQQQTMQGGALSSFLVTLAIVLVLSTSSVKSDKLGEPTSGLSPSTDNVRPVIFVHGIFPKANESDFPRNYIAKVSSSFLQLSWSRIKHRREASSLNTTHYLWLD